MGNEIPRRPEEKRSGGVGIMLLKIGPSKLIRPLLGLLATILLTRFLGPTKYGDFALVTHTILLANTFLFIWAGHSALRFRVPMEKDLTSFFTTLFSGHAVGFVILIVVAVFCRVFLPAEYADYVWLGVPVVFLYGLNNTLQQTSLAQRKVLRFASVELGIHVTRGLIAVIVLIAVHGNLQGYLATVFAGLLVVLFFQARSHHLFTHLSVRRLDKKTMVQMLAFGLPLVVVIFANSLRETGARYIISFFCGNADVGLYNAAALLGSVPIKFTQGVVLMGLYPLAIKAWHERTEDSAKIIQSGLRYFILLAFPLLAFVAAFSRDFITLVSGAKFSSSWPVLSIASVTAVFLGLSQYFTLPFLLENKSWKMIVTNGAGSIVTIVLLLVLVPLGGYLWAAVAGLLGAVTVFLLAIFMSRPVLRLQLPLPNLLRCAVAAIPALAAGVASHLWSERFGTWFAVAVFVVAVMATALMLLLTGELRDILRMIRSRLGFVDTR